MTRSRPNAWPKRFVLVADELSATTLAELPQDRLAGVVVRDGAANSHAAIMVRATGIPTVMGADIQPSVLHRRTLVVDGYRGELWSILSRYCSGNTSALSVKRMN